VLAGAAVDSGLLNGQTKVRVAKREMVSEGHLRYSSGEITVTGLVGLTWRRIIGVENEEKRRRKRKPDGTELWRRDRKYTEQKLPASLKLICFCTESTQREHRMNWQKIRLCEDTELAKSENCEK